jgi:hypothetical protein
MQLMRIAGRFMVAVLWMGLMCSLAGAFSGARRPIPESGSTFHKPLPAPLAIETAPAATTTSPGDPSTVAAETGIAIPSRGHAPVAASRSNRVTGLVAGTALHPRPPPRYLLA